MARVHLQIQGDPKKQEKKEKMLAHSAETFGILVIRLGMSGKLFATL